MNEHDLLDAVGGIDVAGGEEDRQDCDCGDDDFLHVDLLSACMRASVQPA